MPHDFIKGNNADFTGATACAIRIRELYHQLEEHSLGRKWTLEEDMLGLFTDIGVLGRLVMAADGTWGYDGNVNIELKHKLSECLWWILVLSDHLNIDITDSFTTFMDKLDADLTNSVASIHRPK